MRWLVATSLQFRFLVVFGAIVVLLYGLTRLGSMPVDVFPEFAPPQVEIQTEGPGMSTTEVEELITIQLEQAMYGTPGLAYLRSKSVPALSSIKLVFQQETDLLRARQLVAERLQLAAKSLPSSVGSTVMLPPLSSTSRVMKIGMSSKSLSMMDMSMVAWWTVRFKLLEVPGVANVLFWGERPKQLQVQLDPERLQAYDVTLNDVLQVSSGALELGLIPSSTAGKTRTGGFIDTPNHRLEIQHVLGVVAPEQFAEATIYDRKKADGAPLRLGDLGRVGWDTWPLIGDAVINDGPGILLVVEKFPWANTLDVTRGVEQAIDAMRPGLTGIEFDTTIFRPASFIETAIDNLKGSLWWGAGLVTAVLLLFLFEWRLAMISVTIIPLSLMVALLVLDARGSTINVMILAGLAVAIGAVVDDAIVDVENIVRRLRQLRREGSDKSTARIVLDASLEVRGAIVWASLIEISALMPVFFLDGLTGSFFQPLAQAYVIAVFASMLAALTLTPALILILLSRAPIEHGASPLNHWLGRIYERILVRAIRWPRLAYATVGVIVIAGVGVVPFLGQELLPSFRETDFLMHWVTAPGTGHSEMYRMTQQASRELRGIPGVRNFGAHIARAVAADEVVGMNFTENWISISPSIDYDRTVASVQATVDGYPGLVRDVQTYLKERTKEVLSGTSDSIVVRISGPNLQTIRGKAQDVRAALSGIEGVIDLKVQLQTDVPQVQVEVDLARAQRYGLTPGDVRRAAAVWLAGLEVSDIHRDGKVYDVVVWSTPESRTSVTSLRELVIDTPGGGRVRLEDVADVRVAPTPNVIERENLSRKIDVSLNVRGRDLGSVARDVELALKGVTFPLEYHAQVLGEYAERQTAQQRLLLVGAVAVVAIFFLLVTSFQKLRLALLTFFTLPWAVVGGLLAAALAGGGTLSLGSLVGLLTVLGIATRNGIMLISHFQHLENEEGQPFGPGLVVRGARERLAPILMTALATGVALLPLALAGHTPGHEIEQPMAIVILGGLVTSTLLNLLVIPTMYLRFARPRNSVGPSANLRTPT
jgi:CzcA family heavy metal efflux pump